MKLVMKFMCLFILFVGLFSMALLFDIDGGFKEAALRVAVIGVLCLLPIIIIALASYKLEKNSNPLYKGIIGIMFIPMLISIVLVLFGDSFGADTLKFLIDVISFFFKIYIGTMLILFVLIPESNNRFTTIFQLISIGAIVIRMGITLFQSSGLSLESLYGSTGIGDTSNLISTDSFTGTFPLIVLIVEIMGIILTYISNYAFSEDVPSEVIDLDYARLKEDAHKITKERFDKLYNKGAVKEEETPTTPENNFMNINNQLGTNSNVGQVSDSVKKNTKPQIGGAIVQVPIVNKAPQVNAQRPIAVQPQVPIVNNAPQPVSPVVNNQVPVVPQPQPQVAVAQHPVPQQPINQNNNNMPN